MTRYTVTPTDDEVGPLDSPQGIAPTAVVTWYVSMSPTLIGLQGINCRP